MRDRAFRERMRATRPSAPPPSQERCKLCDHRRAMHVKSPGGEDECRLCGGQFAHERLHSFV